MYPVYVDVIEQLDAWVHSLDGLGYYIVHAHMVELRYTDKNIAYQISMDYVTPPLLLTVLAEVTEHHARSLHTAGQPILIVPVGGNWMGSHAQPPLPSTQKYKLGSCKCGKKDLEHFYTSKETKEEICPECFKEREGKHQAKEAKGDA
jgi:hypothetical protein